MEPFDILGELPTGTTVLEASAGTGKTFAVGALVARFVAEGVAGLDEMLVITFGRVASQELRERVRAQLVEAERALADPAAARSAGGLVGHLAEVPDAEVALRRRRLTDALASYDSATIATTHQFCQLVLRSLGVAGDTDSHAELVESLDELVEEVVDDLYLQRFGGLTEPPPFKRSLALDLAKAAVGDPRSRLTPTAPEPGTIAEERVRFATDVRDEVDRRKHRLGILSYDDLLSRLADALAAEDSPARQRMRQRWKVVLVDEFQDTDPVQWSVLDRAFSGHARMVLIGDPKQAIYAFRGGDIYSYLAARETAGTMRTLATNWRSDKPLVDALQQLTRGVRLGDERIVVHPVEAAPDHAASRFAGLPASAPVRLRRVATDGFDLNKSGTIGIEALRAHIARDLAADVARLLASGATYDGRPVLAGDVAVLVHSLKHVQGLRDQLAARGIASVVTSGSNVLLSQAADEWLALLEAMEQPQRTGRVRSAALTSFGGRTAGELDAGGDDLTDEVAETVRGWLDLFRTRGIAAVFEAASAAGLAARVLGRVDGERLLTDLQHLGQIMHEVSHRESLGLPALLEWLRTERASALTDTERTRRLDTDAAAVQILTVHGSKGLQYPIVYLPLLFDCWAKDGLVHRFHDDGVRCLDVGGSDTAHAAIAAARAEDAAEQLRLTYVALTRAQSQVVAWWAPSWNAGNSGLTRLLLGRGPDEPQAPDKVTSGMADADVAVALEGWQDAGAISVEASRLDATVAPARSAKPGRLGVRRFGRTVDTDWRRTSYSGLIRAEEQLATPGVDSEPEVIGTVDEETPEEPVETLTGPAGPAEPAGPIQPAPGDVVSPMADLPAGATFGSLVHGVLEHVDPQATDLAAEVRERVVEQLRWWPVDATIEDLTQALLPMQLTSLGSLADGLRLVDLGRSDRLCELDFEFPLAGGDQRPDQRPDPRGGQRGDQPDDQRGDQRGDQRRAGPEVRLADAAGVLRRHLPADDPMLAYADRLESPSLGDQALRGYLSGSIDVVLRVPDGDGHRYLVVDYKTNFLGDRERPLAALDYRPEALADAMLHSHYPLQALLYSVVLHRYLRWRQPGYDPGRHLGGILYLYVRGMCGPQTPEVDGQPCGVFSWQPPAAMVVELSELLDGILEAAR